MKDLVSKEAVAAIVKAAKDSKGMSGDDSLARKILMNDFPDQFKRLKELGPMAMSARIKQLGMVARIASKGETEAIRTSLKSVGLDSYADSILGTAGDIGTAAKDAVEDGVEGGAEKAASSVGVATSKLSKVLFTDQMRFQGAS
jgi:hypothetical protein